MGNKTPEKSFKVKTANTENAEQSVIEITDMVVTTATPAFMKAEISSLRQRKQKLSQELEETETLLFERESTFKKVKREFSLNIELDPETV